MSKFTLTILNGIFTHDTDTFGSMDPYVKITYSNKAMCTQPSTGKNPVWTTKNEFTYDVTGDEQIHIAVYDKDTLTSDEAIADGYIAVA